MMCPTRVSAANIAGEGRVSISEKQEEWFKKRFGTDFIPTEEQKAWVKENWGRKKVPKEEWESVLPPVERVVEGVYYELKHGHYGTWTSDIALTLKEWQEYVPLDPNEPEWSKRAAKDLEEWEKYKHELARDLVASENITPPEWLIKDMLPKKTLNFIGGDAGIGKTLLALQMAACLMTGQDFLGHTTTRSEVLLIERDEPLHLLKDKIDKQRARYQELSGLAVYKGAIRVDDNPEKLRSLVRFVRPDVVFIDSFSAIHYKDENSAMDMRPILDCLRDITDIYGITIVCIHHFARTYEPKKKGHLRGSTVLEAQSDFAIGMDKTKGELFLRPLKARGVFEPIKLMFHKDNLTYDASGTLTKGTQKQLRQQRIRELGDEGASDDEIASIIESEFHCSRKTISRA
jgi:KaiC/GvpD/RAD55 family RecA-like ATPase